MLWFTFVRVFGVLSVRFVSVFYSPMSFLRLISHFAWRWFLRFGLSWLGAC